MRTLLWAGCGLVATVTYTQGGGGQRPTINFVHLQIRAPLINFTFFLRKNFLMWLGGWVRRRSPCSHPPPPLAHGNGKPWPGREHFSGGAVACSMPAAPLMPLCVTLHSPLSFRFAANDSRRWSASDSRPMALMESQRLEHPMTKPGNSYLDNMDDSVMGMTMASHQLDASMSGLIDGLFCSPVFGL